MRLTDQARCTIRITVHACCVVFVAALSTATTHAEQPTPRFEHLTIEDGLSEGSIESITQDRRGFMWFCSRDGLNRYDGQRIKVYKHTRGSHTSMSNNFVRHIVEDKSGNLWIATKHGLNRMDPVTEQFERFHHDPADSASLSSDNIMRVTEDHEGILWVGTWGGGLNSLDLATGIATHYKQQLNDAEVARGNIINAIVETSDQTVWVAAITGLFSVSPDRTVFTKHDLSDDVFNGPRDGIAICIFEDPDGSALWLGTYTGLVRLDLATGTHERFSLDPDDPKNITANQIRYITEAPDGNSDELWMCTANQGLAIFDRTTKQMTLLKHDSTKNNSISHDALWSMYRDRGGTLWVGTDGQGVDKLTPMSARFPHVADGGLNSNSVWSICEDANGDLWVGTSKGVCRRDRNSGKWDVITHRPDDAASVGAGAIYSMLSDSQGRLWLSTAASGLSVTTLAGGKQPRFTHYRHNPDDPRSLSGDRLFSLYEDSEGNIWVGTVDEGIDVMRKGNDGFEHYRPDKSDPASISDNGVECIYQDASGTLWFGTLAGGLNRLDRGTDEFVHYRYEPGDNNTLSNNHVMTIVEDDDRNLWIGTADGLNMLSPERDRFEHYFEEDGLPNSYIYGILRDDDSHLWMSTNNGLVRFDLKSRSFRSFTTRDGLQSNEFNAGAFYRSTKGELFFGGHNGYNHFTPGQIRDNPSIPPVVITSFYVRGEPREWFNPAVPRIELTHRDYFFSFEFASLDYWAPERNEYQYKMEGFDSDWIPAGRRAFASYTNLDPGKYTFRVRGSNSDGVWNTEGTWIGVTILPPFWRTWWFVGIVVVAIMLLAFGLHRYRLNRLMQMERLRLRISADLHDEIATNLSSIAMFSGMIESDPGGSQSERSVQLLSRLRELAEESVSSIRDLIWAINPTVETVDSLLLRLRDTLVPLCRAKSIDLLFDQIDESELPKTNLPPERRQHLWLLLKETVNNAIKHSECTSIVIKVVYDGAKLSVTVGDNGTGFEVDRRHEGNGLQTMQMRARRLGGTCRIKSTVGEGTIVTIVAPV